MEQPVTVGWFSRLTTRLSEYRADGIRIVPLATKEALGSPELSIQNLVDNLPTWDDPNSQQDFGVYMAFVFVPVNDGDTENPETIVVVDGRRFRVGGYAGVCCAKKGMKSRLAAHKTHIRWALDGSNEKGAKWLLAFHRFAGQRGRAMIGGTLEDSFGLGVDS